MCGIAGIVTRDTAAAVPRVRAMMHALRHRGPDGEGLLEKPGIVLGHRRLAIIDLSPAASQPMTSADRQLHVVLNGEIYNYLELRSELEALGHRFRTKSDTEVLLEAWRVWGRETLARIVGMFAFAILDERDRTLVLARDPFGIKPLYYAQSSAGLAFASEIPPLLELPGVDRGVHPGALADYLTRGVNNHEGATLFAGVRELPGAHLAIIRLDNPAVSAERYWAPPDRQTLDMPYEEAVERFRALFDDTVGLHLRSDVPVGLFLSGGQDSSATLLSARHALGPGTPIHAISFRPVDGAEDEGRWIAAARDAAGATIHEISPSPDECGRDFDALVAAQGEPFASPVIYVQRQLFACARDAGLTVVLDGQGSDEFLGGYDRFHSARLAGLLYQSRFAEFARVATMMRPHYGWRPAAGAMRARWAPRPPASSPSPLVNREWLQGRSAGLSAPFVGRRPDRLRETLAASLRFPSIPWLMRYADRNAMTWSLENRVPFLTTRLVDFALGLPEDYLVARDGTGKRLLRDAMRGRVPDVILSRRRRIGFDVPVEAWLSRTPGLAARLERMAAAPALDRESVNGVLSLVRRGGAMDRRAAFDAWKLATLESWSRAFGVSLS